MKPVLTKQDFVRRYAKGEFGNASPTWLTVNDWYDSRVWDQSFHFDDNRYHLRNRVKGGMTFYNLRCSELRDWKHRTTWVHQPNWYVSAMAPTETTLIQGEVQRTSNGLYLYYTQVAKPMRDALKESSQSVVGLSAKLLLQRHMDSLSYEWLEYLLDEYEDHIVEFSTYGKCFGTVPGRNTVVWEVRKY